MLKKITRSIVIALLVSACKSGTGADPNDTPPVTEDSFDTNTLFSNYTHYSDGSEGWQIANGVLTSTGSADQSVLVRNGVTMTNGWVEAVSDRADDGGLVLRFASPTNYYLLAFRDDSAPEPRGQRNLAIYHHVGLAYDEIWNTDITWARGTARTIRFEADGPTLRVYVDSVAIGAVTPSPQNNDQSPYAGPGGVGVRASGLSQAWASTFQTLRWHVVTP